jgi:hypothetical protein
VTRKDDCSGSGSREPEPAAQPCANGLPRQAPLSPTGCRHPLAAYSGSTGIHRRRLRTSVSRWRTAATNPEPLAPPLVNGVGWTRSSTSPARSLFKALRDRSMRNVTALSLGMIPDPRHISHVRPGSIAMPDSPRVPGRCPEPLLPSIAICCAPGRAVAHFGHMKASDRRPAAASRQRSTRSPI